ncbi:invasin, partial [Serratia marcescens]
MTDVIQTGFIKTQKRFWRRRQAAWLAGPLMWLAGMVPVCAESPPAPDAVISSEQQAADPAENLPDLGGAPDDDAREKQWAEMAKQLGEKDLNNVSRQQMRSRAEDYLLGQAADTLQQQAQELLSPLGTARLSLKMTGEGNFTGSNGQLFSPLYDVDGLLTYSQIGWLQQSAGALGNFALGQRWIVGDWLLGYNTALDSDFARQRNRGSVGAEAWGDYLRFST